jgi:hypothetical protein
VKLLKIDAEMELLDQASPHLLRVREGRGAHRFARSLVTHPDDHPTAAFIGEGTAIFAQVLEVSTVLPLLELVRFALLGIQPFLKAMCQHCFLLYCGHNGFLRVLFGVD